MFENTRKMIIPLSEKKSYMFTDYSCQLNSLNLDLSKERPLLGFLSSFTDGISILSSVVDALCPLDLIYLSKASFKA